jgi:HEAT repeat protein
MLYTAHPAILLYMLRVSQAPRPWRFDLVSALIGAAVALLLAGLAYRSRAAIRSGWESLTTPATQLHRRLQASAEDRYRDLAIKLAHSLVIPSHAAPLDAVFVEPRLLCLSSPPQLLSEPTSELPGPEALPLHWLLRGHPQLAILGAPGMGRTMLLAYVALTCARTASNDEGNGPDPETTLGLSQQRLPLYVSLPTMDWPESEDKEEQENSESNGSDGVERLLNAAVTAVGGSGRMIGPLRQWLETGRAIVLADGWDELSPSQRLQAVTWLAQLVNAAPGNLWLVGAGMRGYAPLVEHGFVPLTLATWNRGQLEALAKHWIEACPPADQSHAAALHGLTSQLRQATRRGASPLELALRAFVYLSDGQAPTQRTAVFDRALDLALWTEEETSWLLAACRAALGQVALTLQQTGRTVATREEVDQAIKAALPPTEEHPGRVFQALTSERGLLRTVGTNRYAFAHPLWRAYLAARQLVAADIALLADRLEDPRWAEVIRFYAELGDMKPLIVAWLRTPDDMFQTRLRVLSSWVGVAPEEAAWRDGAMAVLARGFLRSGQPSQVRRTLAEALATTGTPGVTYFFKQALQHPDIEMRIAAIQGLARAADESDIPTFETALKDKEPAVREAAVRGLAHLSIDAATRLLEKVLVEGEDMLKPAAAEALAHCGEEGATFLREAVNWEDVAARRAAVFGLIQLGAQDLLKQVAREDEQWIVRSAAAAALEEMEEQEKHFSVAPLPEIEQLPWLISWAAAQGEGVGLGQAARHMLRRALAEGDAPTRVAAALTLAQVGHPDDVEPLQAALSDPDSVVANAALEGLAQISRRYELLVKQGST